MLQIKNISKTYITGDLKQKALDNVSLNLRDNEFVAILGPSGSGKTTLLNVIGGLDRYDKLDANGNQTCDLIINGISTKKYKDKDWDSYRNHTVGFIFQSYNLISHQSILANVELALTISGVSSSERKARAIKALEQVGLGNQLHKRPNQLSGGQMQRVAIARALVNDPKILLADEPTGALDTETSIQVMDLLKEVAKDRLVVMVTHNPELADKYATRIVHLQDGKIIGDSNPYEIPENSVAEPLHKNLGKASMSRLTALSLSFNNLLTKKGRTFMTAFAGSIGIIGIALILSLSAGVNNYITELQKDTMMSYPVTIEAKSLDLASLLATAASEEPSATVDHELDGVYSNTKDLEAASSASLSIQTNNLTAFKKYLDDPESEIHNYLGESGIVYSYNTNFNVYTFDSEGTFVNTDGSTLNNSKYSSDAMSAMDSIMGEGSSKTNCLEELLPGKDGQLVSQTVMDNYEVVYGSWPQNFDEVILLTDKNNEISSYTLYQLGLLPTSQYKTIMKQIDSGETIDLETSKISYEDICKQTLILIPACDTYVKNSNGFFESIAEDETALKEVATKALQLKIVGIIRPCEEASYATLSRPLAYTNALIDYLVDYSNNSEVVKAQMADPEHNILNGADFAPADDQAKVETAKNYLINLPASEKAALARNLLSQLGSSELFDVSAMSESQLAQILDLYLQSDEVEDSEMLAFYDLYINPGSYDDNLQAFGYVSLNAPTSISLYSDSFEDKDHITACIKTYNASASDDDKITYTDYVGLLMSSVTTIVNVISYVLIAFVAVSLVVSSIMIGIITYISVLERTKEIGILRALGASKRNVTQVFKAETFIIGLCSGILGILITLLLLVPGNAIIHTLTKSTDISAALPMGSSIILILLSVLLTSIGGKIPAKKAAKKDPVAALRSE